MTSVKKYLYMAVVLLLVVISFLIGNFIREKALSKGLRMVYIPKVQDVNNDFWSSLFDGAKMAAEEYDVDLKILAPLSENDYEGQIRCVEEAIAQHPDVILLSPTSLTKITGVARKVIEADIKLILVDSTLNESIEHAIVATDNFKAGVKMGEFLKTHMSEAPVIGIVAHVEGSSTAVEREAGLRHGLGDFNKNVIDTIFCDSDYEKAYRLTKDLIARHPDINVIAGLNEYSAVGAARAVKALGKTGQIQMIGFDSSLEEVRLLEAEVFDAIVIQKPFNMGYLGIETAIRSAKQTLKSKKVDSGSELITKENMYTEKNQKLLFPF